MRLIDADALEDMEFETYDSEEWYPIKERVRGRNRIRQIVKDAPTVDAVPVVRCKDCKYSEHWYRDKARCFLWHEKGIDVFENGFCNYAERRTE